MKKCLACNAIFPSRDILCQTCGFCCAIKDDFPAYAPSLAQEGVGFKSSYFSELAKLEANNFWFRARNRLIIWALGHYCQKPQSFLEIGCGTGYVLSAIANAYPDTIMHGSELFTKGLMFASERLPLANLMQMDARHIPFMEEFDSIGAFDVLEHITEDQEVLQQIHQALKPRGILILTVPQHMWLWSPVDEHACHVRRYCANGLQSKLEKAGFEVLRSTSFVASLLPAMLLSRLMKKITYKSNEPNSELELSSLINVLFEKMLNLEIRCIRRGINFRFGGSRLVVAQKLSCE